MPEEHPRPEVRGKFLWRGGRKLWVRGVTYGTFRPGPDGADLPPRDIVAADFAAMAAAGFNTVRTYTPPPPWVLDVAAEHGLLVMVGLPWEQHVAFLDDRDRPADIEHRTRETVRGLAGHPAILCWTIGNEIPASIVRWHGRKRIERFLLRLFRAVKDEDPGGLVTYVNFPTTEYLELPFLDLCAFNVYLEDADRLAAYLARLQNVAGDRPLVMAEIGLDSRRNGELAQAESLRWQLRTAFRAGCAGAMVFAWTDEWHRGGHDVEDWDFGLVRRDRSPKPALEVVRSALADVPVPADEAVPRISVVVCSYNGARTLDETLRGVAGLDFPDFEVILVDDGSTDGTAAIGRRHGARVISTPNRGLSSARNTGAEAATGEIVAYLDDDAWPDPDWLTFLAVAYADSDHAGVGGPNLAPPGDGTVATCVANAPGNPIHVLLSDTVAEHIPGCNSSFRREQLLEIGGFDTRFRVAGDDVDLCWRLQERGWTIGFSAAAMVWHHRRGGVRAFWRQQRGYGRAEAMLQRKWPQKYNGIGHVSWAGRVYAPGRRTFLERWRVYYGTWGSAPFQRLYSTGQPQLAHLPLMPEWFLVIGLLAACAILGTLWAPLLVTVPLTVLATAAVVGEAWVGAGRGQRYAAGPRSGAGLARRALTAFLFVLQSSARLHGRLAEGLRPWSRRARRPLRAPRPRRRLLWSETWQASDERLHALEQRLRTAAVPVRRGGDLDRWDLEVRDGSLASARLRIAVEEHGSGKQQIRVAIAPRVTCRVLGSVTLIGALAAAAFVDGALVAALVLLLFAAPLAALTAVDGAAAVAATELALVDDGPAAAPAIAARRGSLLRRIQDDVMPGEVVAVVGARATGPRALAELLIALSENGPSAADRGAAQRRGRLHRGVSILLDEPYLLPLTVAENIALGRPDAAFAEIRRAVVAAGADEMVESLPQGYDTIVGDGGVRLSAAQLQRLAIARAFLQDAPILVLGEAVLGAAGDEGLGEAVGRLIGGRRAFVVVESLAHAGVADRVLVLHDGRVAEHGPHEQLLAQDGLYAELFSQAPAASALPDWRRRSAGHAVASR